MAGLTGGLQPSDYTGSGGTWGVWMMQRTKGGGGSHISICLGEGQNIEPSSPLMECFNEGQIIGGGVCRLLLQDDLGLSAADYCEVYSIIFL